MKPAMFEMSPDTRLLRQRLRTVAVGGTITYAELGSVISKPVTGSFPALQSAIRSLLRHDAIVFAAIRGVGLKRLNDEDIVSVADRDVDGVRRKAKRGVLKLSSVADYSALPPAKQLAHTARMSVLTAVAHMATDGGMKKVEAAAAGRSGELPISDTLRAFGIDRK